MCSKDKLEARREPVAKSVEFFDAKNKTDREKWVACEYLENLGETFNEDELVFSAEEPPDVLFRGANFEIKEILSEDRRRHQEYKKALQNTCVATAASELDELIESKVITLAEISALIVKTAKELAEKKYPPDVRRNLDLLFYVNLTAVFDLVETPFPDCAELQSLGYRSVAFIMHDQSVTLAANSDAPIFVRRSVGQICRRNIPVQTDFYSNGFFAECPFSVGLTTFLSNTDF